ncbi:acetyl-CoA C-acetyltransferase [Lentibacter sp.]|uniref:acetyl-CoA C-acetyltransferase n=1 Tax=Lentibacter sp. TaxID=2024994 RepID=UPI003F6A36E4
MTDAFIFDHVRSPRGRGKAGGALNSITPINLAAQVLASLRDRNQLDTSILDDVILGCVAPVGEQGANVGRVAAMYAGYAENVPGQQLNRFCASGLEAVNNAAAQVMSGQADAVVAGGLECMSRVPMGSDGGAIAVDPSIAIDNYFVPQGISADIIATKYGFTRDMADAMAVESQKRAKAAWDAGHFSRSVVPVYDVNGLPILAYDEFMRPETDMQSLGALNPSFKQMGEVMPGFDKIAILKYPELERINHIHHAGNSSGIVDGAAAVLIGNKELGEQLGLKPRARIRATAKIGTDPTIMLTGPVPVTEKILRESGMSIGDIDLFEVNEAFASVVMRFEQAFNVDHAKVNVNGGSIAMGHPLGATGAMILSALLDELERSDKETGLATLCIGSGMGAATIIERV